MKETKRNSCVDCKHRRGQDCWAARTVSYDGVEGVEEIYMPYCRWVREGIDFCPTWEKQPTVFEKVKLILRGKK